MKCSRLKIFIAVLCALCASSFLSSSAFAYDYSWSFYRSWRESEIFASNGDYFGVHPLIDGSIQRQNMNWYDDSPLRFDRLSHLSLHADSSFPEYSLVSFTIEFSYSRSGTTIYEPSCPSSRTDYYTVVSCSMGEYGHSNVVVYIDNANISTLNLYFNNNIMGMSGYLYNIDVSAPNGVVLTEPVSHSDLEDVNSSLSDIIDLLGNTSVETQIAANTQRTADLIEAQNDAQQSQYDSEKQEESDREDSASGDVDSLNSSFSFEITDPLSYIFDSFTSNNNCVSIPTIAGFLNSSETTYCPWFSSSVRNTLTPVFSTFVTVLCYGFLVSWLRKGDN